MLAAVLFCVYFFFQREPLNIMPFGDIRAVIFGKDLRWLRFLAVTPLIFFVVRLIDLLTFDVVMRRGERVVAPQILRAITSVALYCIFFGWAISIVFHYAITGWLALPTVLAAIVGLALQDTLGNLASGISLHIEDSYEVGDVLRSGDFIGTVESISWRATRIRTFNNTIAILPNSQIARDRIEVFPRANLNGRILSFGVDYHVPPAVVIPVLTQAAAHVDGVAREIPCFSRVAAYGDSAVTYDIKYYTYDFANRDRIDAEIRKAVWYALQRNDISIAFPIRSYQPYTPPKAEHLEIPVDEIRARLEGVGLLAPLSPEAHADVGAAIRVHYYAKGETILRRGAAGDSMFVIHKGLVSIRISDDHGVPPREIAQLGPGEVFGEMALLTGEARAADAVALTDTAALEIAKGALQFGL